MKLAALRAYGFGASTRVPFTGVFRVACDACQAIVINGHPTHEHGCANAVHECGGCNALVPRNQRFCEECVPWT